MIQPLSHSFNHFPVPFGLTEKAKGVTPDFGDRFFMTAEVTGAAIFQLDKGEGVLRDSNSPTDHSLLQRN